MADSLLDMGFTDCIMIDLVVSMGVGLKIGTTLRKVGPSGASIVGAAITVKRGTTTLLKVEPSGSSYGNVVDVGISSAPGSNNIVVDAGIINRLEGE